MLLNLILRYYDEIRTGLADGATLEALLKLNVLDEIKRAKLTPRMIWSGSDPLKVTS